PTNKHDVGKRLALWALANDYGKKDLVYSGPLFKSMDIINNKIRLFFDHADGGLMAKENHLTNFEIAGSNRLFYPARAEIDGNTVVVSAEEVKNPISVRYAFHNADEASLFNNEGLPASSFRTNDWPIITERVSIKSSFNNISGSYIITLLASDGFDIYYTSDGTEPNLQSHLYKNPFLINKSTNIKAIAYLDNTPSVALVNFSIIIHLSTGKKVSYKNLYANKYTGSGEWALVNSIKGSQEFNDGNWQGFNGKDVDIVIDLEEEKTISNISTGFLQNQQSWILFPAKVEYFGSSDGSQFDKLGEVVNKIPQSAKGAIMQEFLLNDINGKWRYLKVRASKLSLPNWHAGAGEKAWLFADEIIVN
ncbi:MAG: chitobiase/beta-hexosaminidase C-terminal domain-containing protein, partial [Candidatus Delongbacteria bacterium]|nr:chitobiase/beta-hexosaminidase C-terminal domain-containing protein [Candidatus Delongbacteria bacterium]